MPMIALMRSSTFRGWNLLASVRKRTVLPGWKTMPLPSPMSMNMPYRKLSRGISFTACQAKPLSGSAIAMPISSTCNRVPSIHTYTSASQSLNE